VQAGMATFGETMRYLAKRKTFWFIAVAAAIKAFIGYGHAPFTASFFFRNHTEEIARLAAFFGEMFGFDLQSRGFVGLALGIMSGTAGAIGALAGGWIADKFGKNDLRAYMVTPAIAALLSIPVYIAAVTVGNTMLAFSLLAVNAFLATLWYGPVYGTAQSVVPPHMRATAAAILLFIINLIGLGLGPLLVGILSDVFAGPMGMGSAEGVRWALITAGSLGLVSGVLFWLARKTIREELVS
jgi:MFS family permease